MTHPATPEVGGDPVPTAQEPADATNAFEEMASEWLGDDEPEEATEGEAPVEGDEPEVDEVTEDEPEPEADELPPIEAPVSWTAEEKERFAGLPRETQEFISKRETEREKFVQTKAQEASQARQQASVEAQQWAAQMQAQVAQQLEQYAQQLAVGEPDPELLAHDPATYARQLKAYQYYNAQRQQAQHEAEQARAQAEQYQAAVEAHEAEQFRQRVATELPDFFDETKGPALKERLTATAKSLGFSDEDIFRATAGQILALNKISEQAAKADKYDALMRKQMERVRSGKNPPPVAKPGQRVAPDANRRARAEDAFQRAKNSQGSQRVDAFADYLTSTGQL